MYLDGDEVRKTLSHDLGFSLEDRRENLRRIAKEAIAQSKSAQAIFISAITPLQSQREMVRQLIEEAGLCFSLVYVNTSLATCMQRDVKGMYAKAKRGEIFEFTGIDSPFEPPTDANYILATEHTSIEDTVSQFCRQAGFTIKSSPHKECDSFQDR